MIIGSALGILINVVLCFRCMFPSTIHVKHSGFPRTRENVSLQALTQVNAGITQPSPSPLTNPEQIPTSWVSHRRGPGQPGRSTAPPADGRTAFGCVHVYE